MRREPRLGCILDETQAALVTPGAPTRGVLWKSEIMDQIERPRARGEQSLELRLVRLERRASVVEPADKTCPSKSFDLGAVMVGRGDDLVPGAEPDCSNAVPEPVARTREQRAGRLVQGKRLGSRPAAEIRADR